MIFLNYKKMPSQGVTLSELLVVIAIIALTAAITVPFYRTVSMNLDLKAASRDIASDLRLAQQLSVTTQVNHKIVFNLAGNSYSLINIVTGLTVKSRNIKSPVALLSVNDLPADTVTFNSTGAVAATGTIVLTNPNNRQTTIEIKPSGYVKIQ